MNDAFILKGRTCLLGLCTAVAASFLLLIQTAAGMEPAAAPTTATAAVSAAETSAADVWVRPEESTDP